jgi:hypothetical protein
MAMRANSGGLAHETNQRVTSVCGARDGAGMTCAAGTIDLTSCNASQPDPWPLVAPNRPITIPYSYWRAGKGLTSGYSCQKKE